MKFSELLSINTTTPQWTNLASRSFNIDTAELYNCSVISRLSSKSFKTYYNQQRKKPVRETFFAGGIFTAPPSTGETSLTILSRSLRIISAYARNCVRSLCSTSVCRKKNMLTLSFRDEVVSSSRIQEYRSSCRALCLRANWASLRDEDWDAERCRSWSRNWRRPSNGSKGMMSMVEIDRPTANIARYVKMIDATQRVVSVRIHIFYILL